MTQNAEHLRGLSSEHLPIDAETLTRLHDRLRREAAAAGLLDLSYRTVESPVGTLLLARTSKGLVRVAFERENHDEVLDTLARKISPRILSSPRDFEDVTQQLDEYFHEKRTSFTVPLDLQLSRGFRLAVLNHLGAIGYGNTESYAEVAFAAGSPRAVRAVGTACATNPLPIVVPCHRVVRSDGSLGAYLGGAKAKQDLLTMEARHQK